MTLEKEKEALDARLKELRKKRDQEGIKKLQPNLRENRAKAAQLEMHDPAAPARAMVLDDLPKPHDSPVFIRGEAGHTGDVVPPGFWRKGGATRKCPG